MESTNCSAPLDQEMLGTTTVSVVVPTHYRPTMLSRLLDSLGKQTYPHHLLEAIVVASQDDTEAFGIVEKYANQSSFPIRCVSIPEDPTKGKSASAKRNFGVEQAVGDWIAFIDDDCEAHPDWIASSEPFLYQADVAAVEGQVSIPPIVPPTLTYKGLLQLTKAKGYQTCNMFYKRDVFLMAGGFDLKFPFYLEDSDLAWTVLDAGYQIPFASQAIVFHPVVDPEPWRLWDVAKRVILIPYLYQKHPSCYQASGKRAILRSEWVYLALYAASAISLLLVPLLSYMFLLLIIPLVVLHAIKLFWGCRVRFEEVWVAMLLLPVVPIVKFVQLLRGNLRYKVWLWT